jgi:hypothetical protein
MSTGRNSDGDRTGESGRTIDERRRTLLELMGAGAVGASVLSRSLVDRRPGPSGFADVLGTIVEKSGR